MPLSLYNLCKSREYALLKSCSFSGSIEFSAVVIVFGGWGIMNILLSVEGPIIPGTSYDLMMLSSLLSEFVIAAIVPGVKKAR